MTVAAPDTWDRACLAVRLFALRPFGTGLHLLADPGPARDALLALLRAWAPDLPQRRCPAGVADDRLWGGLDLPATLAAGRPVAGRGLLAEADGGLLLVSAVAPLPAGLETALAAVLDTGELVVERDGWSLRQPVRLGLVLLDGCDGAATGRGLPDRLAFQVDLRGTATGPVPPPVPVPFGPVHVPPGIDDALAEAACTLGIDSLRAVLLARRAAKDLARLAGRTEVTPGDAATAAALVLAHRARHLPAPPGTQAPDEEATGGSPGDRDGDGDAAPPANPTATVLDAVAAVLPPQLLENGPRTVRRCSGDAGRGTRGTVFAGRGRPAGHRSGRPDGRSRLAVLATLVAAAPWQALRRPPGSARMVFAPGDLRVRRFRAAPRRTAVFVVDASGSTALHRLAEAKGAVELLLSECYVRRDAVALLTFRDGRNGAGAELVLPPTRALARARRCLLGLPGGGGTPLAAGLAAAAVLVAQLRRRGEAPLLVLMTDGRANVALDGSADRARAQADALRIAGHLRDDLAGTVVVDISPRPSPATTVLAAALGARHLPLPFAGAAELCRAVRDAA